jgi:hypothetical protein
MMTGSTINSGNGVHGWQPYEGGATSGGRGSEGGTITQDEEHADGARITLERDTLHRVPFAITCGIYGWLVHTRFFADEPSALAAYGDMKAALERILRLIAVDAPNDSVGEAVDEFVEQYP